MKSGKIALAILLIAALGGLAYYFSDGFQFGKEKAAERILDPAEWKAEYPAIYASYMRNSNSGENVEFGGEQQIDLIQKYPDIKVLYEGYGFSKEYFSARGHVYAMEDVIRTMRPKPGATCLSCKTAAFEGLYEEHGDALFTRDFVQTAEEAKWAITCYSCHRNEPGKLYSTVPHATVAFAKLDNEIKPGSKGCAQCHVEYYLQSDDKAVVLPWDNGLTVEDYEKYYDDLNFADWTHPRTGTPLIKIQHPEYEMYQGSPHQLGGLECSSCHMPKMKDENGTEYTSHWWTSPLKTIEESCGKCHGFQYKKPEEFEAWVNGLQKEVADKEAKASQLLVQLVETFAMKIEKNELDEATIAKVRSLHRQAQIRWDFSFAENSTGAHNFEKAHKMLDEAIHLAEEAIAILNGQRSI